MSGHNTFRRLLAPLAASAILSGYGSLSLADGVNDSQPAGSAQPSTTDAAQPAATDAAQPADPAPPPPADPTPPPPIDPAVPPPAGTTQPAPDTAQAPAADTSPTGRSPSAAAAEPPPQAPPAPSGPPPVTWMGITVYGTVDIAVAHLTHGAPLSNTYPPSLPFVLSSYSNRPITSLSDNGLSQSKLGLSGIEPLGLLDLKAVFKLETAFQPTSGRLSDGPKSLIDNNGIANAKRITAGDSGRAGQPFQGAAWAGVSSPTYGVLTFGRQNTLMADDLIKYDPQLQSTTFSPIGFSGVSGGFGDTEDKTLDDSVKYTLGVGPVHVAGLYQFGTKAFEPESAASVDVGAEYAGFSIDAVTGIVYGAVSAASLSAAQNMAAPGTVAGTISDNTGYAVMANYAVKPVKVKLYAGYEYMKFTNPKDPVPVNTVIIGGYVLSAVNNAAYKIHKVLEYSWAGVRYTPIPPLDISVGYYHFSQNSYNANHCTDNSAGSCSGTFDDASLVIDYKFTRRFDVYAGINYTTGSNGLVSGFINDNDVATVAGIRFNF